MFRMKEKSKGKFNSGFWLAWFPLLAYAAGLLIISVTPAARPLARLDLSDKLGHAAAYCLLSFLFWNALSSRWKYSLRTALAAASLAFCYGALLELFQFFLPYRFFESLDLLSNAAGAVAAQVVIFVLRKTLLPPKGLNGGEASR